DGVAKQCGGRLLLCASLLPSLEHGFLPDASLVGCSELRNALAQILRGTAATASPASRAVAAQAWPLRVAAMVRWTGLRQITGRGDRDRREGGYGPNLGAGRGVASVRRSGDTGKRP